MPSVQNYDEMAGLWNAWRDVCTAGTEPIEALKTVLARGGTRLSSREVRLALGAAMNEVPDHMALTGERFADCMIPLLGDPALCLQHAFSYFGEADRIDVDRIRAVVVPFASNPEQVTAMLEEIDRDGDRYVSLSDFLHYFPAVSPEHAGYRASHVQRDRIGTAPAATQSGAPHVPETRARANGLAEDSYGATSPLQMQIGFFRLLQGAAYRSFRESYSANAETHLRARDLPYTITDFEEFVAAAVDFYLSLGIVRDAKAAQEFNRLTDMVSGEVRALETRIDTWDEIPKTAHMVRGEEQLAAERDVERSHKALFADTVEIILALRMHGVPSDAVGPHSLNQFELNRLSHLELQTEHHDSNEQDRPGNAADSMAYLNAWNPVNHEGGARPDGAIMPVRFWYEEFMPQLLRCASVMSADDLAKEAAPNEAALDSWHASQVEKGAFAPFAMDLQDGFSQCTPEIKHALKQAWRLTDHYLNGLEKRREREEFGRGSGFLSQYVAFIDVWLGRADVAQSEMRVSFPYYIGPAVWCLMHSSAELIEGMDENRRADAIVKFKRFFAAFATMYPCPYCRHHLNRYVVRNREVDRYPIEFLFQGQMPEKAPLDISLQDRLTEISASDPGSFRRFVWKLHNAVSSSIARSEDWYHQEKRAIYTTRYWPGLEAEMARANALQQGAISVDKLEKIVEILKPATRLATLRDELQIALKADDNETLKRIAEVAQTEISELDAAVENSHFLSRTYSYDPQKTETPPHFSPQEEAFARSGKFIER
jgi:hypothetical protein